MPVVLYFTLKFALTGAALYTSVWKKRWSTRKGLWGNCAWKTTGWWWAFPFIHVFCNLLGKKIVKSLHLTVFQDYHSTQFTWSSSCPSWSPCSPTSACRMTQEIWKPLQMRWSYSAWYICPQQKVVKFKMHLNYWSESQPLSVQVWREFKTIFRQQEQMKTFPPYDGMDVRESQWGRKSANMAVCKEANWIPFIQVWGKQIK